MAKKKLKLNEKKTECLIIGTKHDITKYDEQKEVSINNEGIVLSRSVRNLGFVIDNNLTCNEQIQTVIKNANFSLRNIAFIKKYLDDDSIKKTSYHNYIITRLDYCNSLYYELPAYVEKTTAGVVNLYFKPGQALKVKNRFFRCRLFCDYKTFFFYGVSSAN